jgi:hypothetical protein
VLGAREGPAGRTGWALKGYGRRVPRKGPAGGTPAVRGNPFAGEEAIETRAARGPPGRRRSIGRTARASARSHARSVVRSPALRDRASDAVRNLRKGHEWV